MQIAAVNELQRHSTLTSRPDNQATLALDVCALGVVLTYAVDVHMQTSDACNTGQSNKSAFEPLALYPT